MQSVTTILASIAACMTIIWVGIQIRNWYRSQHRLYARYFHQRFLLPEHQRKNLEDLVRRLDPFFLAGKVADELKNNDVIKPGVPGLDAEKQIKKSLKDLYQLAETLTSRAAGISEIETYLEITIENRGNEEVRDLVLHLPIDGVFEIAGKDRKTESFSDVIQLGAVHPGTEVVIDVWTTSLRYSIDSVKITHTKGSVKALKQKLQRERLLTRDFFFFVILPIGFQLIWLASTFFMPLISSHASPQPSTMP